MISIKSIAAIATSILSLCGAVSAANLSTSAIASTLVDDAEAGWIWNQTVEYSDPSLQGGRAHAGGPGSYGAYTFHGSGVDVLCMTGPSLQIDGRVHRFGHARFSIDGKPVLTANSSSVDSQYGVALFHVQNLTDAVHVLQVEPEGGWVVVDSIRIYKSGSGDAPEDVAPKPLYVADAHTMLDTLTDWNLVAKRTPNWCFDKTSAEYFLGDSSRVTRTIDDTESILYTVKNVASFTAMLYAWRASIKDDTKFYVSVDDGLTFQPITVKYGTKTYTVGSWGYYNVVPAAPLPAGVTNIAIEFSASGNNWDPQLAQISIAHQ